MLYTQTASYQPYFINGDTQCFMFVIDFTGKIVAFDTNNEYNYRFVSEHSLANINDIYIVFCTKGPVRLQRQ